MELCKVLKENQFKQIKLNNQNKKEMEKEIKYMAPGAEVLSAQVEKGFEGSGTFDVPEGL